MNLDHEDSDPDDLRPSHVHEASFSDQNAPTPEERKTETVDATVNWIRAKNTDGRTNTAKGLEMTKGSLRDRFSTHQHPNLEFHRSSPNRILGNRVGQHYIHSQFDKRSGILRRVMKLEVATPDIARSPRPMPDAQGSVRTMVPSDYIGYQDPSEGKKYSDLAIENLASPFLSSVEISSKSYRSKSVQKNKSLVHSVIRPSVSVRSGKRNPLKRHKTQQHPKTHTKEEIFKSQFSNLNTKEQSGSGQRPFFNSVLQRNGSKTPAAFKMTKPKADSSNSIDILSGGNRTENSATKGYACGQCRRRFKEKQQLTRHQGHTEKKSIECKVCSKSFSSNSKLAVHLPVHTGEKPFECKICKKTFPFKSNLENHIRIHSGEKPFTCEICNSSFLNLGHLRVHRRMHTEEKPYMCEICLKMF